MAPVVSVVIPTRDRAQVIGRAVRSVLAQTVRDLECIVVDDGSTDGTAERLATIPDPRLRYVTSAGGLGAAGARNEGIDRARGAYVAFCDSDDAWLPRKLEEQLARCGGTGASRPGLVGSWFDWRCGDERRTGRPTAVRRHPERHLLRYRGGEWVTSTFLVDRRLVGDVLRFDADLAALEDLDLAIRISRSHPLAVVPRRLVLRANPPGVPRLGTRVNVARGREQLLDKHVGDPRTDRRSLAAQYRAVIADLLAVGDHEAAARVLERARQDFPRAASFRALDRAPVAADVWSAGFRQVARARTVTLRRLTYRLADALVAGGGRRS